MPIDGEGSSFWLKQWIDLMVVESERKNEEISRLHEVMAAKDVRILAVEKKVDEMMTSAKIYGGIAGLVVGIGTALLIHVMTNFI